MDAKPFRDYYADLGLEFGASLKAIKRAFFTLAKQHHPDKSHMVDSSEFRRVREAYEKLSDATFRAAYNKRYGGNNYGLGADVNLNKDQTRGPTRTEAYEAEMADERPPSPPHRPSQYARDQEEQEECDNTNYPPYAHGLMVKMTSHPAIRQRCINRIENWKMQAAGTDICVFCMKSTKDGTRCPSCEVLACASCLKALVLLEYRRFGVFTASRQSRSSGA